MPHPPTHGDLNWAGTSQPEPQALRETPPLPSLSAVTAPAHSSEGLEEGRPSGESAPSARGRAGLHQPQSLGQRRPAAIARSCISASHCGRGSPALPRPALPSPALPRAPARQMPPTSRTLRSLNSPGERGAGRETTRAPRAGGRGGAGGREKVGEEGGARGGPRWRGEYPPFCRRRTKTKLEYKRCLLSPQDLFATQT